MIKSIFYIISLMMIALLSQAQNTLTKPEFMPKTGIKVSYLGSITYPGAKIGLELPLRVKQLTKNDGNKIILKERYLTANLGFYHHADFHTNWILNFEWQMRRQGTQGWFGEWSPTLGYSRTLLDGTAYQKDASGNIVQKTAAGHNMLMFGLNAGIGYDFSKKSLNTPLKSFLKVSLMGFAPYNSFFYPRPSIEIGVIYMPFSFLKTNPKVVLKNK
jgi:hypothetical protein